MNAAKNGAARVSNEEIISAYKDTGSVWKAGNKLGISGQTVHAKLRAVGYPITYRWTPEEIEELTRMAGTATIGHIADHLGRSYAGVACKINELGVGSRYGNKREKKIPRGQGYDKASIKKHIKALEESGLTMTRYARQNGIKVDTFVTVLERHFPEWWAEYRKTITYLPEATCPYCGTKFYPSNTRHIYCTRKCSTHQRVDRDYFGGQRKNTIGLAENTCQICERKPTKGLSSHHVLGKENDPNNECLIALCSGCHNIITALGARDWTAEQWESMISLAYMRKHGPEIAKTEAGLSIHITVDIDIYEEDEDEEAA